VDQLLASIRTAREPWRERGAKGLCLASGENNCSARCNTVHHTVFRLTAHPARYQEKPRADRVCHRRGSTTCPGRLEIGSQLRERCATTERSQASGSKLNGKLDVLLISSLLIRSNMLRRSRAGWSGVRRLLRGKWWCNSCASGKS
jgi:hypothetical protein